MRQIIKLAGKNRLFFMNLFKCQILVGVRKYYDLRLGKVRAAVKEVEKQIPTPHPLLNQSLETDGEEVFSIMLGAGSICHFTARASLGLS
jgi:hypothetical protein